MTALAVTPSIVSRPGQGRQITALVAVPGHPLPGHAVRDGSAPAAPWTVSHLLGSPMSESPHGEQTLDDVVSGVWEELAVRGFARCPVCAGEMLADVTQAESIEATGLEDPEELLHPILSGVCRDCGTELD
jgi:hypothetical protein